MPKQRSGWFNRSRLQDIAAVATIISLLVAVVALIISHWSPFSGQSPAKPGSPSQTTIVSSPISHATPTPIPSPAVTPTEAATPTPTASRCPASVAETPTPTPVGTINPDVTAVVTMQGCPPATYPVVGVFGFYTGGAYNEAGVWLTSEQFLSFGGGYMGSLSLLGLSPENAYSGPPLYAWLYAFNGGGYAVVISNTAFQPTQQQLGGAAQTSGYVNLGVGSYLPGNYKLVSTTPQANGNQSYRFNLTGNGS